MKAVFCLIFLLSGMTAIAQRRPGPPRPPMPFHHRQFHERLLHQRLSYPNVLTGRFGIGAIDGFAGVSGGAEYERFIDRKNYFSASLAVMAYGAETLGEVPSGDYRYSLNGVYFAPGINFHPLGNARRVDLSFGINFPVGSFHQATTRDDYSSPKIALNYHKTMTAIIGRFNANFHVSPHGVFGVFLEVGGMQPKVEYPYTYYYSDAPLVVQFGIRFGGRF